MELIKFIFSSFWIFVGSLLMIYVILYFVVNGMVQLFKLFVSLFRGWDKKRDKIVK